MFLENAIGQCEDVVADHVALFGQSLDFTNPKSDGCRDGTIAVNTGDPGDYGPKVEGHGLRRDDQDGLSRDAWEVAKPDRAALVHGLLPVLRRRRQRGLAHIIALRVLLTEGAVRIYALELSLNPFRCSDERLHHGAYEGSLARGTRERGKPPHERHVELADQPSIYLSALMSPAAGMQGGAGMIEPLDKVLRNPEADGPIRDRHDVNEE